MPLFNVIKRDTIARAMISSLEEIEDAVEDIRFSKDRAEEAFRKLMTDLDIEPIPMAL